MRPSERLGLMALLILSLILAALRPPGAGSVLLVLAVTAAAAVLLCRAPDAGLPGLARDAAPYAVMVVIFTHLQPAIEAINPARYDAYLAGLDQRWLGDVVRAWRGAMGRPTAFTDTVYLAYASFYFLPVVVLLAVRTFRRGDAMERASFTILLGFYLSFVGYFLWPTSGPRQPSSEEAALGGEAVSRAVRAFLNASEGTTLDAFPSGHTAMSLLTAHVGIRHFPRAALPIAAWAAAVVFATVYVQVHYAVDVLAGALLYLLTLALTSPVHRWLGGDGGRR
jgi:membrane-associated phospholipid phosphatase